MEYHVSQSHRQLKFPNLLYILLFLFSISFRQVFPPYLLSPPCVLVTRSFPLNEVVNIHPLQSSALCPELIFVTRQRAHQ